MNRNKIFIPLLMLLASCGGSPSEENTNNYEAERLNKACTLDSITIRQTLDPDTVSGRELLDHLSAQAWILVEDSTGYIISEKNATQRMYMASLTKMMTCLLSIEEGRDSDSIYINKDSYIAQDSRVKLGDGFLTRDLIYEMMLISDNDAAFALANYMGGDTIRFCQMMNEKAQYLGMGGTHYDNPNGLPNDSNYSTARDQMILARYCLADSSFAQILGTKEADIPLLDGRHLPCRNSNALLHTYDGCFGIKTGFTYQAGACLAAAATRNGVTLYVIVLKSRNMALRFKEAAILLDYGFNVISALNGLNTKK